MSGAAQNYFTGPAFSDYLRPYAVLGYVGGGQIAICIAS